MAKTDGRKVLIAKCHLHPWYRAEYKPKTKCSSCWLLYVMRWQYDAKGEGKIGSLNPYAFFLGEVDLEEACSGIEVESILSA